MRLFVSRMSTSPVVTLLIAVAGASAWSTPAWATHLRGQVVRVGFPGSSGGESASQTGTVNDVYRLGRWTPVVVELTNDDGDQFDGRIEVRQADADGDEVVGAMDVSVRGTRRFNLYVPGGLGKQDDSYVRGLGYEGPAPFSVRVYSNGRLAKLFDDKDEPVTQLTPPRQVMPASASAVTILDISRRPVNQLDRLKTMQRLSDYVVMRCGPKEVPDIASGLEVADIIVWDAPDPTMLDGVQNEALLEWTRRGGRLILGIGKDWNVVAASKFGPLLPARLGGTQSSNDPKLLAALLDSDSPRKPPTLTYCPMTSAELAGDAMPIRPRQPNAGQQIWVARRPCGRGQIILIPAELQELLSVNPQDDALLRDGLLQLRLAIESDQHRYQNPPDIFSRVAAQTAFQTTSGFYFTFAFAFVIAYIVVITAGCWGWLKRRSAIRHAWVLSAFIAAGASGLSLIAVQVVRALGQGVHEMTIVDGHAGAFDAVANSYVGFKTASHTLTDLCVPCKWLQPGELKEQRASLRPQPAENRLGEQNQFSVPLEYEGVAQIGELRSVPFRATLKQFEVTWHGDLDGRLVGLLKRRGPQDDRLDTASWVENQLGTDLHDCFVFVRSSAMPLVYSIPALAKGERITWSTISRDMEQQYKETHKKPAALIDELTGEQAKPEPEYAPPTLRALLGQCMRRVNLNDTRDSKEIEREQGLMTLAAPPYVPALLLLTFFSDPVAAGLIQPGEEFFRSNGQQLEMWSSLDSKTGLFVGFSEDPGPMRLCRRKPGSEDVDAWKAMKPARSVVMYRFTMPVQ